MGCGFTLLRLSHRTVLPQIVQLLRTQRTARIRVLDRLTLLVEGRSRRRWNRAIVELLWLVVLHLHAGLRAARLRKLLCAAGIWWRDRKSVV